MVTREVGQVIQLYSSLWIKGLNRSSVDSWVELSWVELSVKLEGIFDSFMSAYRRRYSCDILLIRLIEDWKIGMDQVYTAAILSTDMSKAFDSMSLLTKLKAYGLSREALSLMRSYFSDRRNRTKLGNVTSRWEDVTRGRPQGSSLGPLLWHVYQNDIFYVERKSQLSTYADDHQLYYSQRKPEQAILELNTDGKNTSEWYKENFLEGNLTKYQTMISSKQDTQDLDVEIDGRTISFQLYFTLFTALTLTIINTTDELKLLDVTIDEKLTFSEHISATCKKASSRVGVLMRLRKLIPVESKLRIYKAAILPYLTYCGVTWHFCKKSDSSKLDRINERGLRAVYSGDWSSPYSELLARAKMTTLT